MNKIREKIERLPLFDASCCEITAALPSDLLRGLMCPPVLKLLQNAGMTPEITLRIGDSALPLVRRWALLEPFYQSCQRCYPLALWDQFIRKKFAVDSLNIFNIEPVGECYRELAATPQWGLKLREEAGIVWRCVASWPADTMVTGHISVPSLDFLLTPDDGACRVRTAQNSGMAFGCFDDFLKAAELCIDNAWKLGVRAFSLASVADIGSRCSWRDAGNEFDGKTDSEVSALRRFMLHLILDSLNRLGVVLRIHAASVTELTSLRRAYPAIKIDVAGCSHLALDGVNLNLGETLLRHPGRAVITLRRLLDDMPSCRIAIFSTGQLDDAMAYGAAALIRELAVKTFTEEIEQGLLDFDRALAIAETWFHNNPDSLYKVG